MVGVVTALHVFPVPIEGLEPPSFDFVGRRCYPLSYMGMVLPKGFEPSASSLSEKCSNR